MLHDVYALQREHGAEMTTRTGNTIYGFNFNAGDIYDLDVNTTPRYRVLDAGGFDTGDDVMLGEAEADLPYGGEGNDEMDGGEGRDTLFGEDGDDTLVGGNDRASLFGGEGDDLLQGGGGNDTLYWAFGLDTFEGGAGLDIVDFVYSDQDWTVHLGRAFVAGTATFGGGTETLLSIEGVLMGSGKHQARRHRAISRCRCRGRAQAVRGDRNPTARRATPVRL